MRELRAMTVQKRRDDRWVGWLATRDTSCFTRECCEGGHATLPEAADHAAHLVAADAVQWWMNAAKTPGTWAHEALSGAHSAGGAE